jgi:hypothetical protein
VKDKVPDDDARLRSLPMIGVPEDPGGHAPRVDDLPACGQRPRVEPPATDDELARIAMDYAAGVGDEGAAWCLGPWFEALDPLREEHRRAWRGAVAACAFALSPGWQRSSVRSWCRDDPRPTATERGSAVAVLLTPCLPWRVVAAEGDRWRVEPMIAVQPWWVPQRPVDLSEVGWLDAPCAVGRVVMGRLVPTADGEVTPRCATLATVPVDAELVRDALAPIVRHLRVDNIATRREDVLRRAAHHLLALAHGGLAAVVPGTA